jgi:hypothetical protein
MTMIQVMEIRTSVATMEILARPSMPFEHELAEPMVRPGRAALAGIQENWEWIFGKFPGQDSARNTYALEHDPAQRRVGFLPQVDRR